MALVVPIESCILAPNLYVCSSVALSNELNPHSIQYSSNNYIFLLISSWKTIRSHLEFYYYNIHWTTTAQNDFHEKKKRLPIKLITDRTLPWIHFISFCNTKARPSRENATLTKNNSTKEHNLSYGRRRNIEHSEKKLEKFPNMNYLSVSSAAYA